MSTNGDGTPDAEDQPTVHFHIVAGDETPTAGVELQPIGGVAAQPQGDESAAGSSNATDSETVPASSALDSPPAGPTKLTRQGTPRLVKSASVEEDADDELDETTLPNVALGLPPTPANGSVEEPLDVPMTKLGRSVTDQTHVAPHQRKGVRFVPGCGGSREADSSSDQPPASLPMSSPPPPTATPGESGEFVDPTDDVHQRGIPEEYHWIERLFDPNDLEVTIKHAQDHPEIWTDDMIAAIVKYIRPHDLTGMIRKALRITDSPFERNVTISFRNLTFTDANGRPRLQGITGYIRPKMMMCVLGGPDAGITTFLDVIAQRQKGGSVTGELLCDGLPYGAGMSRSLGYVTKEDTNLPTMTVRETLLFSAALRQPKQRRALLEMRVNMCLKFIGMLHVAETIVGNAQLRGISGGERRRLSYACEIMAGHACVVADLPTNGLDSASAYSCLATIRKGVMAGRSMACSLVQPSPELYRLFSHVMVLSKGSQLYFGPITQVELYFGHHGFKRPYGKDMPSFLEELSSTPGKFYVGRPPPPVDYLLRIARDPASENTMVDIDSLQAAAAAVTSSGEYTWSELTAEDEEAFNVSKDDRVSKAVMEVSVMQSTPQLTTRSLTANFRNDVPPELLLPALAAPPAVAPQKKLRSVKQKYKSFKLPETDLFDVPFEAMDELVEQGLTLKHAVHESFEASLPRDQLADARTREHLLQRKWIWMVQCYRRSPIYDTIGQRMFSDMLQPRGEPIPFTEEPVISPHDPRSTFRYHSTFLLQLIAATRRQWLITVRNPAFTRGAFLRNVVIGLLVGSLFYQVGHGYADARTRFGLFYFVMSFCSMVVVQMIPQLMEQRAVYYHQVKSGYFNGLSYYLAFVLTSVPFAVCEIFLFLIFVYPLSGLRGNVGSGQFFFTWFLLFILNLTTRAWVLFIASISKNQTIAQALCPITLLVLQVFCGFMVPFKSIPNGWIWMYYLSPFTYAIKGLMVNELYGVNFNCVDDVGSLPYAVDPRLNVAAADGGFGGRRTCPITSSHDVLNLYDMDVSEEVQKWYMLLWLVLFFIGFNIMSAIALLFVDHSSDDSSEVPNWTQDVRDHSQCLIIEPVAPPPSESPEAGSPKSASHVITVPRLVNRTSSVMMAPEAYISFDKLCYSVPVPRKKGAVVPPGEDAKFEQRHLLTNVFGYATPKNMVALMGPSGAGKSTLLDVLAGKKTGGTITGDILINGRPRDMSFTHIAGYVEQFDSHDPFQTIREAIEFSAALRLDSSFSAEQRRERVDSVIEALNLGHMQHHMIGSEDTGGISPELRKKTTIAVELVMAPSLLFLDEPTTGLDSAGALAVMHAVSRLAQNISVLCTIHQPSTEIVSLFNSILLLKSQGEVAYFGPIARNPDVPESRGLVEFFEDQELFSEFIASTHPAPYQVEKNKADFALEMIRSMAADVDADGKSRTNPARAFLKTTQSEEVHRRLEEGLVPAGATQFKTFTSAEATNGAQQFMALLWRTTRSNFRNVTVWRSRFTSPIIISLLLGTLYFQLGFTQLPIQNRISLVYLNVIILCFSAQAFLPNVFAFRAIYFRETQSHMYSAGPFWSARLIAEIPYVIIEVMEYGLIMYWIAGLTAADAGGRWGLYLLALFGTRFAALGFCEGIGRLVPDLASATGAISVLNTTMMLFVGFLIQKNSIPQGWIFMYYISFFRYPVSFLCANELRSESFYCSASDIKYVPTSAAPTVYTCTGASDTLCLPVCALTEGTQLLDQFSMGYSFDDLATNLGVIFVFAAGFQLINLLACKYVNHVKR